MVCGLGWVVLVLWLGSGTLLAAAPEADQENAPIEIASDLSVIDDTTAEFTGNVTVVQEDARITCDRMVIYFGETGNDRDASAMNDIQKYEFSGQVRIHIDNRLAVSDQAVYTTVDRKLRLSGPSSKIIDGPDEISGGEIVFDRSTEQVIVTKGEQEGQVKVILRSNQRGLN